MLNQDIRTDSLVLYKQQPARVASTGDKLKIQLAGGKLLKVRPKDVMLLHPGPVKNLNQLQPVLGEPEAAWEILAGSTTNLGDLAELAYGSYSPSTAWAAWQLVADGVLFQGTPQEISVRSPEQVERDQTHRLVRANQQKAWTEFLGRARTGVVVPEDGRYLKEVENLALGKNGQSRALRELGRAETPESAHAFLLGLGFWDYAVVPYRQRLDLPAVSPGVELGQLPDEPRADLTWLPAFAIDDQGNQEPDDAISLEGNRLWVHIADVSALVPPDSPTDLEARTRGASLYLPDGTVNLLPLEATHRLGLGLDEISPALSFGLDLDSEAKIIGMELTPSWVRVTRLSYEQAEEDLDQEPLRDLYQTAQLLQARRQAAGSIEIDLPEVRINVENGQVRITELPALRSRDLVLEAMLAAGEAAAQFAMEQDIPFPFTVQDPPDIDDRPTDMAGMFGLRRFLKPSHYQVVAAAHSGLGLQHYTQVTSPLRRYLDLVAHQQLRAYLRGHELMQENEIMARVGAAEAVRTGVRQAERLARRHWTLVYLMQHPDWRGMGAVVDKRDQRATILVPALDLEVRVHLRQDVPLNGLVPLKLESVDLPELIAYMTVPRD